VALILIEGSFNDNRTVLREQDKLVWKCVPENKTTLKVACIIEYRLLATQLLLVRPTEALQSQHHCHYVGMQCLTVPDCCC
jgi:hypothetical protein